MPKVYFTDEWYADCLRLESYIAELQFYSGSERQKMTRKGKSMLYGVTWKGFLKYDKDGNKVFREKDPETGLYFTKCRVKYPELHKILKEFSRRYFPDFHWTQCQLNKDFEAPWHFDSANIGESILLTLGDYTGGKTRLMHLDERVEDIDSHYQLCKFNGSKIKHCVLPFEGTRYSIVFFDNLNKKK